MFGKYKGLLAYQIRTDLHTKYVGSMLGAYWSVINPLMQAAIYVVLFSVIFKARLGGTTTPFEYALFCLSGLGAWFSFQESVTGCTTAVVRNSAIVKNMDFPVSLFPISAVLCSSITMLITYSALLVLHAIEGKIPGLPLLALPLVLLTQWVFALGIGFYLATLGTFFRDINQIIPVMLQFFMLMTPVVYQINDVPQAFREISEYNPLYYIIDGYRQVLYYDMWPQWNGLGLTFLLGVILCLSGYKVFRVASGYFEAVV